MALKKWSSCSVSIDSAAVVLFVDRLSEIAVAGFFNFVCFRMECLLVNELWVVGFVKAILSVVNGLGEGCGVTDVPTAAATGATATGAAATREARKPDAGFAPSW